MQKMFRMVALPLLVALMLAPSVGAQDNPAAGTMEAGNLDFSFDFYQQVSAGEGNLFFSPYSILNAFWLAFAGADGDTAAQMSEVLRFIPFDLLPMSSGVAQDSVITPTLDPNQPPPLTLRNANALWAQAGFPWLPDYLAYAESSGAPIQQVDFGADPEAIREQINAWVEAQTEDKIQDLLPQGTIDAATRMVIANAVYFNANWLYPFEESLTQDGAFTLLDGSTVAVPLMSLPNAKGLRYVDGDGYAALVLPYAGGNAEMVILLPDAGNFEAFEAGLTAAQYRDILSSLTTTQAQVTLPRFSYEQPLDLAEPLVAMGLTDAFDPNLADFGRMYDRNAVGQNLFIGAALHKAFIAVDERGTEAAAATALVMELTSAAVGEPVQFRVDRPFIYTIQDPTTNTILFAGRVLNPAG
jgi:serpin B